MKAVHVSIVLLLCLMLTACNSGSDSGSGSDDALERMVADACERLHAAWDRGDHDAVENVMPRLQQRAAEQGYSEREVGHAFEAQCDMPG